ncbi:DUF2783 domain-containing protein [Hydrogenophaga sp. OTU3427]|uniref:DUF2783 domain-containing protein n=1 Tax=Hydrogenophaga sp. OTU3427 TaxID=3043856 RepID=UPI00313E0DC4
MKPTYKSTAHFQDADGFYEQLLDAHLGLTREQSELLNARLILTLANQIGDAQVLADSIAMARDLPGELPPPTTARAPTAGR